MSAEGFLRCSAGDRDFVFRAEHVCHVARAEQLRSDDAPDGRAGSLWLGGRSVPVFSLESALGLSAADAPRLDQHIAVTGDQHTLTGWLVNRLMRVPASAAGPVIALPSCIGAAARNWFAGIVPISSGDALLLLSPNASNADEVSLTPAQASALSGDGAEAIAVLFSTSALPTAGFTRFALSARQVAAIMQPGQVITVPGSAPHVLGVTRWRDTAVPIVEYRTTQRAANTHDRRLIARCGPARRGELVAFGIDSEIVMHRPDGGDAALADIDCPPFAHGVFSVSGEPVALLDVDALLSEPISGERSRICGSSGTANCAARQDVAPRARHGPARPAERG